MKIDKENLKNLIKNLYIDGEYLKKHPSLHEIDSPWKLRKILPLIDEYLNYYNKKEEINLLDVGGGTGLILKGVAKYIKNYSKIKVNRYALDLNIDMLSIQKERNPDLKKALNEDICNTSLKNKEIDLTLMIDVLEHIPTPIIALEELKRISNFIIFKVPLQNNLAFRVWDFIKRGKSRQFFLENFGHVNIYYSTQLINQIERHLGKVLNYFFTNVTEYYLYSTHYGSKMPIKEKILRLLSIIMYKISPKLASFVSPDYIMILSKCY